MLQWKYLELLSGLLLEVAGRGGPHRAGTTGHHHESRVTQHRLVSVTGSIFGV